MTGCIICLCKSLAFLDNNNKHKEKEIVNTFPLTIASKRLTCLGTKLMKEVKALTLLSLPKILVWYQTYQNVLNSFVVQFLYFQNLVNIQVQRSKICNQKHIIAFMHHLFLNRCYCNYHIFNILMLCIHLFLYLLIAVIN